MIARRSIFGLRAAGAQRRRIGLAVMIGLAALWLGAASRVHVNASWSDGAWGYAALPLFGEAPAIGDRVLFEPPETLDSPVPYLKTVRGVPGMRIAVDMDGTVRLDGEPVGRAKSHALDGRPLAAIAPGVIAPDHYYLHADHVDSHDSRYAEIGLVPRGRILGRAIAMPDIPWLGLNGPLVGPEDSAPALESSTILPHAHDGPAPEEGGAMRRAFPTVLAAALLLAAALPGVVSAKDLGVRGATWPVAEPDLLAQIEARLLEMERSGALARLESEARANARRKLEEPDAAPGIAPARERRSRLWDPAITVARDIGTADGVPIAAAGTRVNPLERHDARPRSAVRRRPARGRDRLGARP